MPFSIVHNVVRLSAFCTLVACICVNNISGIANDLLCIYLHSQHPQARTMLSATQSSIYQAQMLYSCFGPTLRTLEFSVHFLRLYGMQIHWYNHVWNIESTENMYLDSNLNMLHDSKIRRRQPRLRTSRHNLEILAMKAHTICLRNPMLP